MKEIALTKGFVTIVDDEDYEYFSQWKWYANMTKWGIYARGGEDSHTYLHRAILQRMMGRPLSRGEVADHIDGNTLRNDRGNLRACSPTQSNLNRRLQSNNTSGLAGVYLHKSSGKYIACVSLYNDAMHIGYYETAREAYRARVEFIKGNGDLYKEYFRYSREEI